MRHFLMVLSLTIAFAQERPKGAEAFAEGKQQEAAHQRAEERHEEKEAEIPHEMEWKWVNFAILAAGLGYLAVKFGGPALRSRAEEIRSGITDAQQVKADAERRAAEIDTRISNLGKEIEEMRVGSRQEMEAENSRLQAETVTELGKIQARAEQEIASAAKHASQDLKAYTAELALQMAEEQLKGRINPQVQDSLVRRFVGDLGGRAAHN